MKLNYITLTATEFDSLPEYSTSTPTGVTIGKKWKRDNFDGSWLMGEYVSNLIDDIEIKWSNIWCPERIPLQSYSLLVSKSTKKELPVHLL